MTWKSKNADALNAIASRPVSRGVIGDAHRLIGVHNGVIQPAEREYGGTEMYEHVDSQCRIVSYEAERLT